MRYRMEIAGTVPGFQPREQTLSAVTAELGQALRLHRDGNLAAAEAVYRAVLAQDPECADAMHLLGVVASQRGDDRSAAELIGRAIERQPDAAQYFFDLGLSLKALGRGSEAVSVFRQGLRLQPDAPEAHNNLGCTYLDLGQPTAAVPCFTEALRIWPAYPEALNNLGNAYRQLHCPDDAIGAYLKAIEVRPRYAPAINNLGLVLADKGELQQAIDCFRQAVELRPDYSDAYHNLGLTLKRCGDYAGALQSYQMALKVEPGSAVAHNSLGVLLQARGRVEEALRCFFTAVQLRPDFVEALWNRSLALLLLGDWPAGWSGYELRVYMQHHYPHRYSKPRWEGSELGRRRLLIHDEIGYGDVFQFIRYLPLVKARGGHVIFEAKPGLQRLLQRVNGIDELRERDVEPVPEADFDVYLPMESLPGLFGTSLGTVPADVPYIEADPDLVRYWGQRLARAFGNGGQRRIGLVWSGNAASEYDRDRSLAFEQLAPLAAVPGVCFVSLQKEACEPQLRAASDGLNPVWLGPELRDFADTAAVIANLDLVISVDTAVAHLAGAMGKPTWTLLSFVPAWRWLLDRSDSPWYPGMRLFRQSRPGRWDEVIEAVAQALMAAV